MRVKLQNFIGEWVEFDIGESATILCAILRKISGDEVLDVVRRNKAIKTYDSDKYCRYTRRSARTNAQRLQERFVFEGVECGLWQ